MNLKLEQSVHCTCIIAPACSPRQSFRDGTCLPAVLSASETRDKRTVGFREVETTRCPPPSFCGRPRLLQTFSCRPGTPNLTRPKRHVHVLSSTPFYALSSPEFCLVVDNSVAMSIENNARSLVLRAVYGVRTLLSANTRLPENPLSTLLHTLKHKGVLEVIYRRILLARII